ncbi:uncharacterized protein LOC143616730 isoform X2 [Bidens hawaiensis]|uniref:uncharacterized protein LOC143616730 isoform X2 n=1 Tax=Bidens hawaiensis TaxID=980011 RepID=UPI00404B3A55
MADVELEELANRCSPGEPTYMMCEKIDGAYVPRRCAPLLPTRPIVDIWAPTEKLFEAEVTRRIQNAHKDDENNQDEQERADAAALKRGEELDEKEALINSKKRKLGVEEGKKLKMGIMEIEGLKGEMVNYTVEEQITKMFDELEAKIKRDMEATLNKVRQLVANQRMEMKSEQ